MTLAPVPGAAYAARTATATPRERDGRAGVGNSRGLEYTPFILEGTLDVTDVDKGWSKAFMKEHGLSPDLLEADHKKAD